MAISALEKNGTHFVLISVAQTDENYLMSPLKWRWPQNGHCSILWLVWCDNYSLLDGPRHLRKGGKNGISKHCSLLQTPQEVILQIYHCSRLKNSPCLKLDYFTRTDSTHTLSLPNKGGSLRQDYMWWELLSWRWHLQIFDVETWPIPLVTRWLELTESKHRVHPDACSEARS